MISTETDDWDEQPISNKDLNFLMKMYQGMIHEYELKGWSWQNYLKGYEHGSLVMMDRWWKLETGYRTPLTGDLEDIFNNNDTILDTGIFKLDDIRPVILKDYDKIIKEIQNVLEELDQHTRETKKSNIPPS